MHLRLSRGSPHAEKHIHPLRHSLALRRPRDNNTSAPFPTTQRARHASWSPLFVTRTLARLQRTLPTSNVGLHRAALRTRACGKLGEMMNLERVFHPRGAVDPPRRRQLQRQPRRGCHGC